MGRSFLLLLLSILLFVAEASLVLPRLSKIRYTIRHRRCELNVSWAPVQPFGEACDYESCLNIDGTEVENKWNKTTFRTVLVPLGIKTVFRARATCPNESEGEWVNITIPQNGTPGTEAVDIKCIWHNTQYIQCSWRRGENASRDALYNLSYWHHDLHEERECTNYTREGDAFRCSFHFEDVLIDPFAISIHGNSEDVRTACVVTRNSIENAIPIKLHPPSRVNITKYGDGVSLNWIPPTPWHGICYEIEVNNTETKTIPLEEKNSTMIPLKSNAYYTFRVRAILGKLGSRCQAKRGLWSDWSSPVEWDDRDNTFYFLLLILIPLSVAILALLLLVYLKRIKMLILPTIPDPGKFLKEMFGDQSEDLYGKGMSEESNRDFYKQPLQLPVKEEPTHLLILTSEN